MSNISNRHVFAPHVASGSNKSVALSGQRLSVVRFKKDKSGEKQKESQSVSIPLCESVNSEMFRSEIIGWFQSVQDEIIRDVCIRNETAVTDEMISPVAVKQWLVQQAAGERFTSDVIKAWFDSELADLLTLAFAEKLGIGDDAGEEETKKLEQMVNVYRDAFGSMAGGRTMFQQDKRTKLLKALSLGDTSGGIGQKLEAKLTAMNEVTVEEMLGL